MNSFVAIDFETANQHRSSVCSVGLVFVSENKIIDSFYKLIKPNPNFYCSWATEIHGINSWDTDNEFEFPQVWTEINARIKGLPLVAHNSAFDEGCLKAALSTYGLELHKNEFFCTYRAAKKSFPGLPNYKLNTVSKHVGFHLENHHNALADAEACAHIAMKVFR
ncbi:MAG TPA: 3'-5' exonuclease [Brumimicrobium sp.]|nr:3'-5' exonuclease [Brumimicrobium sp.]